MNDDELEPILLWAWERRMLPRFLEVMPIAEGARLDILEVPGAAWCFDCNDTVTLAQRFDACPRCAGFRLRLTGGEELRIQDLEVD